MMTKTELEALEELVHFQLGLLSTFGHNDEEDAVLEDISRVITQRFVELRDAANECSEPNY